MPATLTAARKQKRDKQSRSGWGGKRAGAGAPQGNVNAVKHGERSKRAFFHVDGIETLPPLPGLRCRNLLICERLGELWRDYPGCATPEWREMMLVDGIMWQHTRAMVRIEKQEARDRLREAGDRLREAKRVLKAARERQKQYQPG